MERLVKFVLKASVLTFMFVLSLADCTKVTCKPPGCFIFCPNTTYQEVEVNKSAWTIFCYEGSREDIFLLWANPVLKVTPKNGTSESFKFIYGDSPEEVEEKKESAIQLPQVLQNMKFWLNVELKDMSFSAFNQSCIGVHSNQQYKATYKYKNVELWYVAYLCIGMLIFLYAKQLSQNIKLQYSLGVSLGVVASLLILMIILHRLFPQSLKKLGYLMVISSCCASLYFWQLFATSFYSQIFSYWKWILGYLAVTGFLTFGICYKYGPITDQKNLNILQWVIQGLGLFLIYQGTQIPQLSVAIVIGILTLYNLPSGLYSNRITRYIRYKLFKPKVKLLTEEEYQRQGVEETRKALDELRQYCQSPECKPWKVISRLKSPERFASFVEGDSWHVTDQELLEYDSTQEEIQVLQEDEIEDEVDMGREDELISEDEMTG